MSAEPAASAISARGVTVERSGRTLIAGFELDALPGEVIALGGPNGAGKSSALKALAGLWPHTGTISIAGRALAELGLRERARQIAYVPQRSLLSRGLPVREVVRQGRYAHDPSWPGRHGQRSQAALERALSLTRLEALAERPWDELSGGEQRRVLLARALATEAKLILLDEPTASLDLAHALRLLELLRQLARDGHCVVVVLHDLEQVRRYADRTLLLDRGSSVASGPTADVITAANVRAVYGVELEERGALGFRLPEPQMIGRGLLGAGWALLLLAGAAAVSGVFAAPGGLEPALPVPGGAARSGPASVEDAAGQTLRVRAYRRIASASSVGDALLLELAEPERIWALSRRGRARDPERHLYGARKLLGGPAELELLLGQGVDLLIGSHLGGESVLARARSAGIAVYDLGQLRGLGSLKPNMLALATLLGDRSRGERAWQRLSRRMAAVARDIPAPRRKRALYLALYAGKVFGGTRGTSYGDVLRAAGLIDIAADHYRDWPAYDPEQLLALAPTLIVTETGMGQALCGSHWYAQLPACRDPNQAIIELRGELIGDPGPNMLDAAEALRNRVYGQAGE